MKNATLIRSDVVVYFAGPASVLPGMSSRSDVTAKDWSTNLILKSV